MQILLDPADWPDVPAASRPARLYVDQNLSDEAKQAFTVKGWEVVDVRLLPYSSDQERSVAIQAILAGLRVGSIATRTGLREYLELEGKSCGLIGNKEPAKPQDDVLDRQTMDSLLTFNASRAGMGVQTTLSTIKDTKQAAPPPRKSKRSKQ